MRSRLVTSFAASPKRASDSSSAVNALKADYTLRAPSYLHVKCDAAAIAFTWLGPYRREHLFIIVVRGDVHLFVYCRARRRAVLNFLSFVLQSRSYAFAQRASLTLFQSVWIRSITTLRNVSLVAAVSAVSLSKATGSLLSHSVSSELRSATTYPVLSLSKATLSCHLESSFFPLLRASSSLPWSFLFS